MDAAERVDVVGIGQRNINEQHALLLHSNNAVLKHVATLAQQITAIWLR